MNIECKDCGAEIKAPDDAVVGEIVSKTAEKLEIKPAESVGEDWGQ